MMNYYFRSIPSEELSDFHDFYYRMAGTLLPNAWIAELGVANGRGVILMASLMNYLDKPCKIWAVENFSYGGEDQRKVLLNNIGQSGETSIEVRDMDSLAASCCCQDGQFNLVFVDSSHLYENTKAEIRLWIHKVMPDGILAGHDYLDNPQVKAAVDELIAPADLHIEETTHGHGVWWVHKTEDFKLLKP